MNNVTVLKKPDFVQDISFRVLECLKEYNGSDLCDFSHHYDIIKSYVEAGETIQAILPSFPGKPINPNLAPSHIPDGAEEYAINTLKKMVSDIEKLYSPGIHVKLFHDGYYFIHLAMDYDYYRMQEYVDIIKTMCRGHNISSVDMKDVTEGTTYEARMNYWSCLYYPSAEEVEDYNRCNPLVYSGMVAFFYNHYSKYLYPNKSNAFRRRVSKHIAQSYVMVNMSVQNYIKEHYAHEFRLSVKRQNDPMSQKFYVDILKGIENRGLPWMNTLVEEDGKKIIKKFRD